MSIFGRVRGIICDQAVVDPRDVTPESMLIDDFQMDESDRVEISSMVADEFDITVSINEFLHAKSVQDIVDFVQSKIS